MRWTIRRKLTAWIALPLLVIYTAILLWDFSRERGETERFMQQLAMDRAAELAGVYSARLQMAQHTAQGLAGTIASGAAAPGRRFSEPREVVALLRQNDWVTAVSLGWRGEGENEAHGLLLRRTLAGIPRPEPLTAEQLQQSDWYQLGLSGQSNWILPRMLSAAGQGPVLSYSTPILIDGQPRGAVAVHMPRGVFNMTGRPRRGALVAPAREVPATSLVTVDVAAAAAINSLQPTEYAVLGSAGEVIYRSGVAESKAPATPTAKQEVARRSLAEAIRRARQGEGGVERVADIGEELGTGEAGAYWIAFAPIAGTDWLFASAVSENRVMAPLMRDMEARAGVLLLTTLALGGLVYVVAIRMSRPIEQMAAAARQISRGDLTARVAERRGRDEVAELGRVFNRMVRHIHGQMEHIRREAAAREAVESELRVARSIQADLLPRKFPPFPEHDEFLLHGIIVPARQVAGDFFDYFFTRQGKLMVAIADVSGKGVPAAILMAVTRTIIRNLALGNLRPLDIARGANAMLVEDSSPSMFVTLFLCEYDPATGRLEYVNAGHPSPLSVRESGECRDFGDSTAPLLGVQDDWPDGSFGEGRTQLQPGESLVLYTDGVTEARAPSGAFFGDASLRETLVSHASMAPETLCREIVAQVENYQQARQDDITVVVLKRAK